VRRTRVRLPSEDRKLRGNVQQMTAVRGGVQKMTWECRTVRWMAAQYGIYPATIYSHYLLSIKYNYHLCVPGYIPIDLLCSVESI
jgi:hypothetical protein